MQNHNNKIKSIAEEIEADIICCQYCGQLCGNDSDLSYNINYKCCADCVNDVEAEIDSRKQHERDCNDLLM